MSPDGEVTVLLREWSDGRPDAMERLFDVVYPHLRQIAGALFRGESPENLLQPTSVVNELFLKLIRQRSIRFEAAKEGWRVFRSAGRIAGLDWSVFGRDAGPGSRF